MRSTGEERREGQEYRLSSPLSFRKVYSSKALVLDATAFYAGFPYSGEVTCYTTPLVISEVYHKRISKEVITSLIEAGRLIVLEPIKRFIEHVRGVAAESGDFGRLSRTDISIVALGLQLKGEGLKAMVVSDDYSVENLAKLLKLDFSPFMVRGILRTVRWTVFCPGCGKAFKGKASPFCDVCGTKLKRKFGRRP